MRGIGARSPVSRSSWRPGRWHDRGGYPDYILPAPEVVGERALRAAASGVLWEHTAVTLLEIVLGFAAGATAAIVTGMRSARARSSNGCSRRTSSRRRRSRSSPSHRCLTSGSVAGCLARVMICALIVFFPIAIATMVGIRSVDPLLAESCAASAPVGRSGLACSRSVGPPVLFGGLRVGVTLAVIGAVVAEWAGASAGLGVLINIANQGLFDTPLMFVALATLAIIGLAFYGLVVVVERRLIRS